ncbi:Outer membrane efflux protein BepC precursor [compost metagenome]
MIRLRTLLILLAFGIISRADAQDSVWTLSDCLSYAIENNLSIKQSDLDKKLTLVDQNTATNARYPNLNLSTNAGMNLGRSINPTTNQFENTQFSYYGISGGASVLLFGWFQKRYNIEKAQIQVLQSNENYEQLKDDIILNITTAYLRALLAKEQIDNAEHQIELSKINNTRIDKLLDAGKSNILELSQANTQLSSDSAQYIQAQLNYQQSLIELKAIMNFDFKFPLAITHDLETASPMTFNPESVYQVALNRFHGIKANEYAIQIAQKEMQIVKAASLPSINLYYSTGSNYSSSFYENLANGERRLMNFGRQLNTNLSHSVGVGLNIPIFNNFTARNSFKTAKIGLEKAYVSNTEGLLKLKKDIYSACTDYQLTMRNLINATSLFGHAQKAFKAAEIRYEAGLIAYFEYLTEKNKYTIAQQQVSSIKYDLEFKKRLIERFMN